MRLSGAQASVPGWWAECARPQGRRKLPPHLLWPFEAFLGCLA